jgi:hypothetical protein
LGKIFLGVALANSQLLESMQNFYRVLEANSRIDETGARFFEGYPTRLATAQPPEGMGFKSGLYDRIRRALEVMGCIEVIQVGRRETLSIWRLFQEPTQEGWASFGFGADSATKLRSSGYRTQLERLTAEHAACKTDREALWRMVRYQQKILDGLIELDERDQEELLTEMAQEEAEDLLSEIAEEASANGTGERG